MSHTTRSSGPATNATRSPCALSRVGREDEGRREKRESGVSGEVAEVIRRRPRETEAERNVTRRARTWACRRCRTARWPRGRTPRAWRGSRSRIRRWSSWCAEGCVVSWERAEECFGPRETLPGDFRAKSDVASPPSSSSRTRNYRAATGSVTQGKNQKTLPRGEKTSGQRKTRRVSTKRFFFVDTARATSTRAERKPSPIPLQLQSLCVLPVTSTPRAPARRPSAAASGGPPPRTP